LGGVCSIHIRLNEYEFGLEETQMNSQEAENVQILKAHLAINVADVNESIRFYRKLFGIEPSKVRKGYAKFDVENPPLNFTLNERTEVSRGALSHLGIQVASTEDVLKVRERWAAENLITRDEMGVDCCYATQDKTWTRDPDGNEWEVFVVLKDNLPESAACECGERTQGISESQSPAGRAGACC
jgi:catechol 2,3-dioxygenase-like lactoylglutathione lyase family enzyme